MFELQFANMTVGNQLYYFPSLPVFKLGASIAAKNRKTTEATSLFSAWNRLPKLVYAPVVWDESDQAIWRAASLESIWTFRILRERSVVEELTEET